MDVTPVDPRDQTWAVPDPEYRVYFWYPNLVSAEYELRGAREVGEVLAWAEAERGSRAFTLYACVRDRDGLGLVRLAGVDPTQNRG